MVGEAEDLILEMDERGLQIDEFTQSALTRMYIGAGMLDKSWLWFMRFHLEGNMSPECNSANIDAFGEHGHVDEAEKVFNMSCQEDSMEEHDVVPDKCSYNSLVQMLASADLPHLAVLYVRKMQQAGLVSDCVPYCAVISSFVKLGQLKTAEAVFAEMVRFEVHPDVVVYGVLINAFADIGTKRSMVKQAEDIFENLKRKEQANEFSHAMMLCMYKRLGRFEEAIQIAQKMRELGLLTDLLSYNHVLGLYASDGRFKEAVGIFKEMMESSVQPDDSTFKSLEVVLMKCGVPKQAVGKMELTRKKNARIGLEAWLSTLTAVVCFDNNEVDDDV
ncbi:Pentatricopeptide repeat-containing protein [Camellia lanceoleosa]|uniref:Pentatricopeptide repeat-containing protein n=1 Tax=Camellia lanceoleosa TaxID=1840588 RepID=A0ACC0J2H2_9ERIC|nr:Pentatricopeptide repeat-containing protein [Camellia lanceoleosa]